MNYGNLLNFSNKLSGMYHQAEKGEQSMNIRLFGIKYANQIKASNFSTCEIAEAAGLSRSYGTEISKGVKLSKYVQLKECIA